MAVLPKRMSPPAPHDAPLASILSASVITGPPAVSTRFILPRAKKPMALPSGEKKGPAAPSVPAIDRASFAASERTQSMSGPSPLRAQKATYLPSGDTASGMGLSVLEE